MHRGIRSLVLTLVLLLVASAAVQARPLRSHPPAGLLGGLWSWVSSVLGTWSKEGGMMDPNGQKEGSTMDPNGRKAGSTMDPDGLQRQASPPGSTSESGGTMDPDG
jgi:hypothetical protein